MLEPLNNNHLASFVPIDIQQEEMRVLRDLMWNKEQKHTFCILNDGIPVLIIGLFEVWDKVFSSYTIFSKSWEPRFYKYIIRFSRGYLQRLDYDRVQHPVFESRPWTDKMAMAFGMKYEGTLRKYQSGIDCRMYALVREE